MEQRFLGYEVTELVTMAGTMMLLSKCGHSVLL